MIRTLHHMAEPRLALSRWPAALQSGATFILEFANKHNLKAILRYAPAPPELEPLLAGTGGVCPAEF